MCGIGFFALPYFSPEAREARTADGAGSCLLGCCFSLSAKC